MKILKWFEGNERADEGGGATDQSSLLGRIEALETAIAEFRDLADTLRPLPVQWATTTKQLNRLVGHITKTNAIDNVIPPSNGPAPPRVLTQDDVIALLPR